MSQYSPSKDLQSKSKSIYSDACQNEAELNQILQRRQRQKKRVKPRDSNCDKSFYKINSKEKMNVKNSDELNGRYIYSSTAYKSFHEEITGNNNDINELDKNLNKDENVKQFYLEDVKNVKNYSLCNNLE